MGKRVYGPGEGKVEVMQSFRITHHEKRLLSTLAQKKGTSTSAVLRSLLWAEVQREGVSPKGG